MAWLHLVNKRSENQTSVIIRIVNVYKDTNFTEQMSKTKLLTINRAFDAGAASHDRKNSVYYFYPNVSVCYHDDHHRRHKTAVYHHHGDHFYRLTDAYVRSVLYACPSSVFSCVSDVGDV